LTAQSKHFLEGTTELWQNSGKSQLEWAENLMSMKDPETNERHGRRERAEPSL
jgi:hypothetical protein